MPWFTPDPPHRYDPFSRLYDTLIDIAERETARAALTADERAEEDRLSAEKQERERSEWLARHAKTIDLNETWGENGQLVLGFTCYDRQQLRDRDYALTPAHGGHLCFKAYDRKLYPFAAYPQYDATGELPDAAPEPNPAAG